MTISLTVTQQDHIYANMEAIVSTYADTRCVATMDDMKYWVCWTFGFCLKRCVQWNLYLVVTIGTHLTVLYREISLNQR